MIEALYRGEFVPKMNTVSKVIVGNLSPDELNTLNFLLKKLDQRHRNIYENVSEKSLDHLIYNENAKSQ